MKSISQYNRKRINQIIQLFNPSMNDYLYVFDLQNDTYSISAHAIDRFALPHYNFDHATKAHEEFVFYEDMKLLNMDIEKIKQGLMKSHTLHYRWLDLHHQPIWINCRGQVIDDEEGKPYLLVGCINEIGKKQIADNITGLLNEIGLEHYMKRYNDFTVGFLMRLSIDEFDTIKGRLTTTEMEELLKEVSNLIYKNLSSSQKLFHFGNSDFFIVDFDDVSNNDAYYLYKKIGEALENYIEKIRYRIAFTFSGGVVDLNYTHSHYDNLMKYCEFSLKKARDLGFHSFYVFSYRDYHAFLKRRWIRREIQYAIHHDFEGFEINYQPLIDAVTNKVIGAEALVRFTMPHQQDGCISPEEFIPLLEETGFIIPVGKWVLDQALKTCAQFQKVIPSFRMNINVSYVQIIKSSVLEEIETILKKYSLSPSSLGVEITESGQLKDSFRFQHLWKHLKEMGVILLLDDYGTGYSNAYRLGTLMPDYIKIDYHLTQQACLSSFEHQVLTYIISMAHDLDLKVCIEGIETKEQVDKIGLLNPDCYQGYYFAKPMTEKEFYSFIMR